jgi:hypothetical protein
MVVGAGVPSRPTEGRFDGATVGLDVAWTLSLRFFVGSLDGVSDGTLDATMDGTPEGAAVGVNDDSWDWLIVGTVVEDLEDGSTLTILDGN